MLLTQTSAGNPRQTAGYDVVIVGSGPSGLTAAYCLAKRGVRAVVVERGSQVGGLMRGIVRGAFHLDLGRKVLNPRFPAVNDFWLQLLGPDYRPYDHRVGVLYKKHIAETNNRYRGYLRGLTSVQTAHLASSGLWSQLRPGCREVRHLEDYYVLRYGRAYFERFVHGFIRKFNGHEPNQLPAPRGVTEMPRFGVLRQSGTNSTKARAHSKPAWRHPARGTQQIVDRLLQGAGSDIEFRLNTEVSAINVKSGRLVSIRVCQDGVEQTLLTKYAIVGLPLPAIMTLLDPSVDDDLRSVPVQDIGFRKFTALVYLMADGEPRFPHNWLEVTDNSLSVGRIVNYGRWNGDMVPSGKTALCLEYFGIEGDQLMNLSEHELLKLAVKEATQNNLVNETKITDHLVLRFPKVNAATTLADWRTQWTKKALAFLATIEGIMEVNRPGLDQATLAGMHAAEACVTGTPMSGLSLDDAPEWQ